jgi:hypothetical protein
MHEQDRRELSVEEAAALVATPLSQVPAVRAVAPTPERFLDLVRDECGVLMSRDLGRIEFVHLSFQEYLAACHVASSRLERSLADRAGDPRWEEVILLAMSRPGVFEPFMTRCLERGDVDLALLRQCLREAPQILPGRSRPLLIALLRGCAPRTPRKRRPMSSVGCSSSCKVSTCLALSSACSRSSIGAIWAIPRCELPGAR